MLRARVSRARLTPPPTDEALEPPTYAAATPAKKATPRSRALNAETLDAITRQALQDELLRLWQASGATVVFMTHDLDEAGYLADTVVLLAGQPARIVQRIEVTTPRQQRRGAPELGVQVALLRQALSETFVAGAGI